tara:strand:+ start:1616 stop:2299 length:684 start_codon:yes stop_codon:yes gene_type:complete
MTETKIILKLSELYGFNYEEALILLNINQVEPTYIKPDLKLTIKPFDGIIHEDKCKAVIYNHGLYTQCENKCSKEFCSSTCRNQKYGHINTRKDYPVGTYVLANGKRELNYSKVIKRLEKKSTDRIVDRITTYDSDNEIERQNNNIIPKQEKKRGRPKNPIKNIEENNDNNNYNINNLKSQDEIKVIRVEINGILYLKDKNNILYDSNTYNIIGRWLDSLNKIIDLN